MLNLFHDPAMLEHLDVQRFKCEEIQRIFPMIKDVSFILSGRRFPDLKHRPMAFLIEIQRQSPSVVQNTLIKAYDVANQVNDI